MKYLLYNIVVSVVDWFIMPQGAHDACSFGTYYTATAEKVILKG